MAKHEQRFIPRNTVCSECRKNNCSDCVDMVRARLGINIELCNCKRDKHSTEPATQQILDPETNAVHAPGLIVSEDGTVEKRV